MANCLVIKLKGVVDNPALEHLVVSEEINLADAPTVAGRLTSGLVYQPSFNGVTFLIPLAGIKKLTIITEANESFYSLLKDNVLADGQTAHVSSYDTNPVYHSIGTNKTINIDLSQYPDATYIALPKLINGASWSPSKIIANKI